METSSTINEILSQVEQLNKEDQHKLLKQLTSIIKRTDSISNTSLSLKELSGLGRHIWKGTEDIDKYIDEERIW